MDRSASPDAPRSLLDALGEGPGEVRSRSVPRPGGSGPYWTAAARVAVAGGRVTEAAVALASPSGPARRLGAIERGLMDGSLSDADQIIDRAGGLLDGLSPAEAYLAAWACADAVGRSILGAGDR